MSESKGILLPDSPKPVDASSGEHDPVGDAIESVDQKTLNESSAAPQHPYFHIEFKEPLSVSVVSMHMEAMSPLMLWAVAELLRHEATKQITLAETNRQRLMAGVHGGIPSGLPFPGKPI